MIEVMDHPEVEQDEPFAIGISLRADLGETDREVRASARVRSGGAVEARANGAYVGRASGADRQGGIHTRQRQVDELQVSGDRTAGKDDGLERDERAKPRREIAVVLGQRELGRGEEIVRVELEAGRGRRSRARLGAGRGRPRSARRGGGARAGRPEGRAASPTPGRARPRASRGGPDLPARWCEPSRASGRAAPGRSPGPGRRAPTTTASAASSGEAAAKDGALRERRPLRLGEQIVDRSSVLRMGLEAAPRPGAASAEGLAMRARSPSRPRIWALGAESSIASGLPSSALATRSATTRCRPGLSGAFEEKRRGRRWLFAAIRGSAEVPARGRPLPEGSLCVATWRRSEARGAATERLDEGTDQRGEMLGAIEDEQTLSELSERAREVDLGRRARFERDVSGRRQRAHDVASVARLAELRIDDGVPWRIARSRPPDGPLRSRAGSSRCRGAPHRHDRRLRAQSRQQADDLGFAAEK